MERRVAALWAEVLGVRDPGVDENFFQAGGDSLRLFRLAALLRQRIGGELELADLFRLPTVREMAARVGEGEKEAAIPARARPWRNTPDRAAPSPGAAEQLVADPGARLRDLRF
jgi:aryl carrier-like protein